MGSKGEAQTHARQNIAQYSKQTISAVMSPDSSMWGKDYIWI